MSVSGWAALRRRIAAGEVEQALQSAPNLAASKATTLSDMTAAIQHAIYARQTELTLALLEGTRRFFAVSGPDDLLGILGQMTAVLAACTREKMMEPAQKTTEMMLELMNAPDCPTSGELLPEGAKFASWAGRFALRRNDGAWFAEIVSKSAAWAAKTGSGSTGEAMLETVDSWLHRILRYDRVEAIPVVFEAMSVLYASVEEKNAFLAKFLTGWRAVAAMACLNPESPAASLLVEELLAFAARTKKPDTWAPVVEKVGEVSALAVTKHGIVVGFPVFRPLMDLGRIQLNDELKFGTGPDPENPRQQIIRLVCLATLRIADVAAHGDMGAVAGDKLEEMYRTWAADPHFEPHVRSIQRFCQLLLIFWANNRKRAAKKWAPREKMLAEPLLLSEEDREKLTFLL